MGPVRGRLSNWGCEAITQYNQYETIHKLKRSHFFLRRNFKIYKNEFYVTYKIHEYHNDSSFQKKQSQSILKLQNASHHEAFTTQKFIS